MKDTCNYGEELEAKYATVAIAYMNGFAQGAGFDPDFKIQEECVEAFNDAGLGSSLGRCSDGEVCFGIGSLCPDGSTCMYAGLDGFPGSCPDGSFCLVFDMP